MINHNPYNLPDKVLKQNLISKPINLQNKKSRDKSYDYSKEISTKGINIQSQMKKSLTLQHVTSSPNLLTPSTSSSTNRQIQYQSVNRGVEYHQTLLPSGQSESQKKIKYLFERFYQVNQQLAAHDTILNRFLQKQKNDRNSGQTSFDSISGQLSPKQNRQKQQHLRNPSRSYHTSPLTNQNHINMTPSSNQINLTIEYLKKQIYTLKQQIFTIKNNKQNNDANSINISKSIKLNSNSQYQNISPDKKNADSTINIHQITKINQSIDQFRVITQQKVNKIEGYFHKFQGNFHKMQGNIQLLGHKNSKSQQRIENLESNIQKHMNLVNQEINGALSKIVSSINDKISKALQNNLVFVNQKIKKNVETCKLLIEQNKQQLKLKTSTVEGKSIFNIGNIFKSSGFKSDLKSFKMSIKSTSQFQKLSQSTPSQQLLTILPTITLQIHKDTFLIKICVICWIKITQSFNYNKKN